MFDVLAAACSALEISAEQVLSFKVYEEETAWYPPSVVLVVDHGVAGGKKYRLPLADLRAPEAAAELAPEPEATEPAPEPEATEAAAELARAEGVPLGRVPGTGSGGRITLGDVKKYLRDADPRLWRGVAEEG